MFWWRTTVSGSSGRTAEVAFTDRDGGGSSGALRSLNLGASVGDDPQVVLANRATVATALQMAPDDLRFLRQVHGTDVVTVTSVAQADQLPSGDGQVTDVPGLGLVVLVADCTPVLLVDLEAGVVGSAHAGRQGMSAGIVAAVLDQMTGLGACSPQAFVGPSVCGRCYEVPRQMREDAARVHPETRAVSWTGTPAIDVASGVVAQLQDRQVPATWVAGCTRESDRLFSHRRDPGSGRFAGIVVLREETDHV